MKHIKYVQFVGSPLACRRMRVFALVGSFAALALALLLLAWSVPARAQGDSSCEAVNLGALGTEAGNSLTTTGRWTTQDCDSRFRAGSGADSYRFEVADGGRIRIDLGSASGDSFLYLLDEDGRRITDNDDGGAGLDARIERDLAPGNYIVEATTVGGRNRGPAGYSLSISRVMGCDSIHLGTLQKGVDLTVSGYWSLDTCGSRFVVEHPAHSYLFDLHQGGRVRIDLMSENGDPVLSLVSTSAGLIGANDDGGARRNSRIDRYLRPGTYLLEATTYLERDYQPLMADFTLVVHLVDEEADQSSFLLKVEDVHTPSSVVAGQPFDLHYRVGNLGGGDLVDVGGNATVYVVGPHVREFTEPIAASDTVWSSGVSYHSGAQTASENSIAIREAAPFEVTLGSHGPSWIFVGVITYDDAGEESGFHGQWHNLQVLSSTTFGAVTVSVDDTKYLVEADSDADGLVTTTVSSVADPEADVEQSRRDRAIYAAGVHTKLLDGIFGRQAVADLPVTGRPTSVDVENPSSSALTEHFADRYKDAIDSSGLPKALAAKEALSPTAVEDILLGLSRSASMEFVSIAASWKALQDRISTREPLTFADAFDLHSELVYTEGVISSAVAAGRIVEAAQAAELGWQDAGVQDMIDGLAQQASCDDSEEGLRDLLEAAGFSDIDETLRLDGEMRVALPVYGVATEAVLCAVARTDDDNTLFLESLAVADSNDILALFGYEQPPATMVASPPHRLRVIARLNEDGRIEHGVELTDGEQILPSKRHLSSKDPPRVWRISSDVEVDGYPVGKVRSRRLDDGRVELGFIDAAGQTITPDIRYLSADIPAGVWLRSGEIEVTRQPTLE